MKTPTTYPTTYRGVVRLDHLEPELREHLENAGPTIDRPTAIAFANAFAAMPYGAAADFVEFEFGRHAGQERVEEFPVYVILENLERLRRVLSTAVHENAVRDAARDALDADLRAVRRVFGQYEYGLEFERRLGRVPTDADVDLI